MDTKGFAFTKASASTDPSATAVPVIVDAGTKAEDHYARLMTPMRFWVRQQLLKAVRLETPILARAQDAVRTSMLDWYFAVTANIGTHTFYMVMLPLTFWYGDPEVGLDVIWVLAFGVFITGYIKDLLCLPRPMSPPLHRISMSGSAVLEYGMPSTHSCNAVSASLIMFEVYSHDPVVTATSIWLLATLISGRLYNGMHGFLDILVGCLLGLVSYEFRQWLKAHFSPYVAFDNTVVTAVTILAISACPSPIDDCPCFDDSVAFAGVVLGLMWTLFYGPSPDAYFAPERFAGRSQILVWALALARFVVGVSVIVTWRHFSKRLLLRVLPPVWRLLSKIGVENPRRYFMPATEYKKVPSDLPTDGIPDSKQEVHDMMVKLRHLRRSPSISVGPQSEADLYELRARASAKQNDGEKGKESDMEEVTIEEPRVHYDVEVFMRLIVYGGICPMALIVAPVFFRLFGL